MTVWLKILSGNNSSLAEAILIKSYGTKNQIHVILVGVIFQY
jgi:hypothetical protein